MSADRGGGAGKMCRVLAALAVGGVIGGCAWFPDPSAPARIESGLLVSPEGMTLYTFDRDVVATALGSGKSKSACVAQCAEQWPPFTAGTDAKRAGEFTIIEREDGTRQWAHKGRPLYRWREDAKPGDRTGDGADNLWRAARP